MSVYKGLSFAQTNQMASSSTDMTSVNNKFSLVFLLIFALTIAQNEVHATDISDKDKQSNSKEELPTDVKEELIEESRSSDEWGSSGDEHSNRNGNGRHMSLWGDHNRQRRSLLPHEENTLDIEPVTNIRDRLESIYSESDYNSGLQAGKRRMRENFDTGILLEDMIKDKRINTDYGYGSRLQAAENMAMDWDRNGLFGVMGPGKRSNYDILEAIKRAPTDFGYGSRNRAAEIAAMSSNSGLYGLHGPGKRSNLGLAMIKENPEYEIGKRFTDYGYRSRMHAAENVAQSASKGGLFGNHGPGKRARLLNDLESAVLERLRKRISSDFGYGSREQAAENIAKLRAKGSIFGVYGPGKRSE